MSTGNPRTPTGPGGTGREQLGGQRGGVCEQPLSWLGALRLGGADVSVGVRTPSPPLPRAPYVLFTCLSACDRGTFIFIAGTFSSTFIRLCADTPNLPGHAAARVLQTPLEESSAFDAVSEG